MIWKLLALTVEFIKNPLAKHSKIYTLESGKSYTLVTNSIGKM
jgi:hypothetical protein